MGSYCHGSQTKCYDYHLHTVGGFHCTLQSRIVQKNIYDIAVSGGYLKCNFFKLCLGRIAVPKPSDLGPKIPGRQVVQLKSFAGR